MNWEYKVEAIAVVGEVKFIFKVKFFHPYLQSLLNKSLIPFYYPFIEVLFKFITVFSLSFLRVLRNYQLSF